VVVGAVGHDVHDTAGQEEAEDCLNDQADNVRILDHDFPPRDTMTSDKKIIYSFCFSINTNSFCNKKRASVGSSFSFELF
jgi:hypothetical protein